MDLLESHQLHSITTIMKSYKEYIDKLQKLLGSQDFSSVPRMLLLLIQEMETNNLPFTLRKALFLEVILAFNKLFDFSDELRYGPVNLFSLYTIEDYGELKEIFVETIYEMIDLITKHLSPNKVPLSLVQVIDYINLHLSDTQLSGLQIANYFYTPSHYLEKIFLEHKNISINDYINLQRVEKAKDLLIETPYHLKVISEQVGFPHVSHFISIFKNHCQLTPSQFRCVYCDKKATDS